MYALRVSLWGAGCSTCPGDLESWAVGRGRRVGLGLVFGVIGVCWFGGGEGGGRVRGEYGEGVVCVVEEVVDRGMVVSEEVLAGEGDEKKEECKRGFSLGGIGRRGGGCGVGVVVGGGVDGVAFCRGCLGDWGGGD